MAITRTGVSIPRSSYLQKTVLIPPPPQPVKPTAGQLSDVTLPPPPLPPKRTLNTLVSTPKPIAPSQAVSPKWQTPRPRTVLVLGLLGATVGALTGFVFRKQLLGEQKVVGNLIEQVHHLVPSEASTQSNKGTEVSTYVNDMPALLMATPTIYPELTQAILLAGGITAMGFLGSNLLDGLQEAWVRWEESCIRAELMNHMQGSFQQGISAKLTTDVQIKGNAKNRLLQLLSVNHISQPERYLAPVEATRFKASQAVGDFLYVPTKANLEASATPLSTAAAVPRNALKQKLASGWLTPVSGTKPKSAVPTNQTLLLPNATTHTGSPSQPINQDVPHVRWLVDSIALLAGAGVGLFGFYAGYSLKQSADKALALKWMKKLQEATVSAEKTTLNAVKGEIEKLRPRNASLNLLMQQYGESPEQLNALNALVAPEQKTFLNLNNFLGLTVGAIKQGEWGQVVSLLALGVLLGVGSSLVNGIREIEVTRLNAKTELSYQQYRLEDLEPLYRRLNDEAELNQALLQLQQDLPYLKEQPEALERRCQSIVSNVGLTPAWISMSPAVQLTMARG
jgi:hypothetical protein